MDPGERTKPEVIMHTKGAAVGTIGIITGSAILGAAAAVSVYHAMQGGVETISTTGLMSFLLTLGLSVSAIVLAIAAIALCRMAELSIAKKSEETSAMQAAMVEKTVSAIERMESSVARIGEEIADNLYENFEMLAGEIQEKLPSRDVLRADVNEAVERALSLRAGLKISEKELPGNPVVTENPPAAKPVSAAEPAAVISAPEPEPQVAAVADKMREKADKKYGEFKDIVLLGVANYPGVLARKIGEGQYRTGGDDLVDGAFVVNNEKVAVCTFCTNDIITDRFMGDTGDGFNVFLRSLVNELKSGHFTRVFLVFDGKLANTSPYAKSLNALSSRIDAETFACFELFEGSPDIIIPELTERVSRLMELPAAETNEVPELTFRRQMGA